MKSESKGWHIEIVTLYDDRIGLEGKLCNEWLIIEGNGEIKRGRDRIKWFR